MSTSDGTSPDTSPPNRATSFTRLDARNDHSGLAGTNTVSFGVRASTAALQGLLGFAVQRVDRATSTAVWMKGYKVFRSVVPQPTPATYVSTYDHPMQSLVWDDFTARPGRAYDYVFHPLRGTARQLDRSARPITLSITTEPLRGTVHDVFFNRGVGSSQAYTRRFGNKQLDQLEPAKRAEAERWLSRATFET